MDSKRRISRNLRGEDWTVKDEYLKIKRWRIDTKLEIKS